MTIGRIAIAALGAAVLAAAPLPGALPGLGSHPAFARGNGGGNGGGHGGGNGGGDHGGGHSSHGNSGTHANSHATNDTHGSKSKASASAMSDTTVTVSDDTEDGTQDGTDNPPNAHGLMASELKGLNAYHASETAFENAAPNSQVGRIATYRDAALATQETRDHLTAAEAAAAIAAADPAYQGRSVDQIEADLNALDPNAPDYQSSYDALTAELQATETYDAAEANVAVTTDALASDQQAEADALDSATKGRQLSPDALAYFREQLGL